MKFQVMSDLHLEFGPMVPDFQEADALILAGDILVTEHLTRGYSSPYMKQVADYDIFMLKAHQCFKYVIFVLGNHEHYNGDIRKSATILRKRYHWLTVLDNEQVNLDGLNIWGGTMWTNMDNSPVCAQAAQDGMNDFRIIKNGSRRWIANDAIKAFYDAKTSLYHAKPDVVISHHAPSWASIHDDYKDNLMNGAYANSMEEYICDSNIQLWVHGHCHNNSDYLICDTRVVCNPRGYVGHELNPDFNPTLVLEVPE